MKSVQPRRVPGDTVQTLGTDEIAPFEEPQPIATSYDQLWVKVAAYGAAMVGSYARVRRGKHFPTDVVVGAVIGTAVGRSVVHFNRRLRSREKEPESAGARLTLLPLLGGGTFGVSASLDF